MRITLVAGRVAFTRRKIERPFPLLQLDVGDHDLEGLRLEDGERLLLGGREGHAVPDLAKRVAGGLADIGVVVDEQDLEHAASGDSLRRRL